MQNARFIPLFRLQYYELFLNWQNFFEKSLKKTINNPLFHLKTLVGKSSQLTETLIPSRLDSRTVFGRASGRPVDVEATLDHCWDGVAPSRCKGRT